MFLRLHTANVFIFFSPPISIMKACYVLRYQVDTRQIFYTKTCFLCQVFQIHNQSTNQSHLFDQIHRDLQTRICPCCSAGEENIGKVDSNGETCITAFFLTVQYRTLSQREVILRSVVSSDWSPRYLLVQSCDSDMVPIHHQLLVFSSQFTAKLDDVVKMMFRGDSGTNVKHWKNSVSKLSVVAV